MKKGPPPRRVSEVGVGGRGGGMRLGINYGCLAS